MEITICPPLMLPAINGTTIYSSQLSSYFNAKVLSTNALDWIAFHSEKGKVHNKGFPVKPILKDNKKLVYAKKITEGFLNAFVHGPVSYNLFRALLKDNSNIIYSLTLPFLNNYYSLIAARYTNKKAVITPFFIDRIKRSHIKLLKKFDLVFACTNYEKNLIGLPNVVVSPMCVNVKKFEKANGERFRRKYGIKGKFVLFVGHANYEKGAYSLLKAARKLNKISFVFLGPHTSGFRRLAKGLKNVILINPQLKNKFDAFAACDVYAMPSRVEAFGISYLEAWACKKPVIAADTPVAREIIGEDGILIPFDSNPTKAIVEALERPELGEKGYKKVKQFDEKIVLKRLKTYLESLN